jgi:hypothetical protein
LKEDDEMNESQRTTPNEGDTVRTTIVGGRPPERSRAHGAIPRGIEVLVKKASVDPEFHQRLLEDRTEAAQAIDLDLTLAETLMLTKIPEAQLEAIIANTHVPDPQRRVFLGRAGAMMLTAIGAGAGRVLRGGTLGSRPEGSRPDDPTPPAPTGSRPDDPSPPEEDEDSGQPPLSRPEDVVTRGIRPDDPSAWFELDADSKPMMSKGIRPDLPPDVTLDSEER